MYITQTFDLDLRRMSPTELLHLREEIDREESRRSRENPAVTQEELNVARGAFPALGKIQAIKMYRERCGGSLIDAKNAIEAALLAK